MKKTLKEQIAKRKKEMEDKEIVHKTVFIAEILGHKSEWRGGDGYWNTNYHFSNDKFDITEHHFDGTDWGGFHRELKYKGKRVFYEAGGGEEAFIPGEWEREFNRLYARAERKEKQLKREQKAQQKVSQAAQEHEERKRWGL